MPNITDPLTEKTQFAVETSGFTCPNCKETWPVYGKLVTRTMFNHKKDGTVTCEHWYERPEDLPEI